jgi:8-oxo-dGTP diphosphatase
MDEEVLQFGGTPPADCRLRPGAYVIVYNDEGKILMLEVGDEYHLPGGRIEEGENPIEALKRESIEEAGAEITDVEFIGRANQYFPEDNMNKIGELYKGRLVSFDPELSDEDDHQPVWVSPEDFLAGNASEYQKWAVRQAEKA